jgi:TrmH family RNA methyltransferase
MESAEEAKVSAHSLIKIPMMGGAESLNASVAAGILIYEIFRKGRKMDR